MKARGQKRNRRSCRFRWVNQIDPNLNHENFTPEEDRLIIDGYRMVRTHTDKSVCDEV